MYALCLRNEFCIVCVYRAYKAFPHTHKSAFCYTILYPGYMLEQANLPRHPQHKPIASYADFQTGFNKPPLPYVFTFS